MQNSTGCFTGSLHANSQAAGDEPPRDVTNGVCPDQPVCPPSALSRKRNHESLSVGASPTTVCALELDVEGNGTAGQALSAQSAEVGLLATTHPVFDQIAEHCESQGTSNTKRFVCL